jgi:UDP-arabinose 4-epimerase
MRVLVAGGAGYIGSHTAKVLAAAGHTPVVYDNFEKGHRSAVRWGPVVEGDLSDRAKLKEVLGDWKIDGVIHFAAYIAVGESMREPERYLRNNVSNSLNLLGAMQEAGVRHIVFSSTAAVYGTPERCPIPEDHPLRPDSVYGDSKLMVERILDWFGSAHGFVAAKLRYFNASGADPEGETGEQHEPETHLIPLALAAVAGKIPYLSLFGTDYPTPDGTAIRDYIHVTDLATAHLAALDYLRRTEKPLTANLGTGQGYTVRQVVATIERVTGKKVPVKECPRRAGDSVELVADATRARQLLGWAPRHSSLDEIVQTAWAWYQRLPAR